MNFRLRAAGYHGPDLFGPEALRIIAEASEGLTRRINIYADKTLLAAFAAGTHTVTADHARAAVTDTQIVMTRRESPRRLARGRGRSAWPSAPRLGFGLAHGGERRRAPPAVAASAPAPACSPRPRRCPRPRPLRLPLRRHPRRRRPPVAARCSAARPSRRTSAVASRLAAGRELLAERAGPRFVVQLMVTDARERGYLESYLADARSAWTRAKLYTSCPRARRCAALWRDLRRVRRARRSLRWRSVRCPRP